MTAMWSLLAMRREKPTGSNESIETWHLHAAMSGHRMALYQRPGFGLRSAFFDERDMLLVAGVRGGLQRSWRVEDMAG